MEMTWKLKSANSDNQNATALNLSGFNFRRKYWFKLYVKRVSTLFNAVNITTKYLLGIKFDLYLVLFADPIVTPLHDFCCRRKV